MDISRYFPIRHLFAALTCMISVQRSAPSVFKVIHIARDMTPRYNNGFIPYWALVLGRVFDQPVSARIKRLTSGQWRRWLFSFPAWLPKRRRPTGKTHRFSPAVGLSVPVPSGRRGFPAWLYSPVFWFYQTGKGWGLTLNSWQTACRWESGRYSRRSRRQS